MIAVGQQIPEATLLTSGNAEAVDGACAIPKPVKTSDIFKGKVVVFAVPGAFTPTCHVQHLPGFVSHYDAFKAKGVTAIYCLSTNDIFVLDAWAKSSKAGGKVQVLADGSAMFTKSIGMELDLTAKGMGIRSQRYAMIIEDGKVKYVGVGDLDVSGAEAVLAKL